MSKVYNFKEWKLNEQTESSNSTVTNITIADSFINAQDDVPAVASGAEANYFYMSPANGQPVDAGTENNYIAFKSGKGVIVKHGQYVAIIAANAGLLSRKNGVWQSPGTTGTMILSINHTKEGGTRNGTGPAIRYNPDAKQYKNLKEGVDANVIGAFILKAIYGTKSGLKDSGGKLMNDKGAVVGETEKALGMVNTVIQMLNKTGVSIPGELNNKTVLARAGQATA
jgi:hypothetical protein